MASGSMTQISTSTTSLSFLEASLGSVREVGDEAVWSLSTAKAGFGVDQLRDGSSESYWQSDGTQPHLVNIQFAKKTLVTHLALYVDVRHDESYTPKTLSIRIGTNHHDLVELEVVELNDPAGWVAIPLRTQAAASAASRKAAHAAAVEQAQVTGEDPPPPLDDDDDDALADPHIRTNFVQLAVTSNHQNGRDTHVRQINVYSSKRDAILPGHVPAFASVEMGQFAYLR